MSKTFTHTLQKDLDKTGRNIKEWYIVNNNCATHKYMVLTSLVV